MRQIKFKVRFKIKQYNESFKEEEIIFLESKTHEIYSLCIYGNHVVVPYNNTVLTIFQDECECIDILQFTGLTDKNGKEIYEGDIVKITYCPLGSNPNVIEYYNIGVVEFKIKTFGVTLKREGTLILDEERALSHHKTEETIYIHPTAGKNWFDESLKFSRCEIIGNEFDNPELLNPQ